MTLLLVHGWGFDADFWLPLRQRLADLPTVAWDLGFFAAAARPAVADGAIAVGHSYGLLWLLRQRPCRWRALVAINGFSRFAGGADFPAGVPPRQIARLAADLERDPAAAVAGFRRRCGSGQPLPGGADSRRLRAGLDHLASWDERPAAIDLALCGESDVVVPPALSRACFSPIRWHPGGHLLPLQDPDWCATVLRDFITDSK